MPDPTLAGLLGTLPQDDQVTPNPLSPAQPPLGRSELGQPLADQPAGPAFAEDEFVQDDQDAPDPFTPEETSSPDQTPSDDPFNPSDRPSADETSFGDDRRAEDDHPAALDPRTLRYADGTPLEPRAPRFKDGTVLEVEMLQGSHPKHLAQFVSVAPGNYAVLVKGLGYARVEHGGLYAFDMRAHMDGTPTPPYDGIPFFGWGADIDVDAMLASDGIEEFADELDEDVDEFGGEVLGDGSGELPEDGAPRDTGEDALARLTPDQRQIAEALINNGAEPDAAIRQARELIHSEGDVIPGADARTDLLQPASSSGDGADELSDAERKLAERMGDPKRGPSSDQELEDIGKMVTDAIGDIITDVTPGVSNIKSAIETGQAFNALMDAAERGDLTDSLIQSGAVGLGVLGTIPGVGNLAKLGQAGVKLARLAVNGGAKLVHRGGAKLVHLM